MRTKHIATTAAVLAATAAVLAWPASSATAGPSQVLRLTTQTDQFAFVDQGTPGPSVGDQLVFSDRVYRDGTQIGSSASTCTIARVAAPDMTCQLVVTFALPDGQLTLHGITHALDHPPAAGEQIRFALAVTGGTDHYRTARGDAAGLDTGNGVEQYTIHLSR
jgi:hypothetical protein